MKQQFLIVSLLAETLFNSCRKCPCGKAESLLPAFIGYSESQTDTLILRRYANAGNFSQLIDTLLINEPLLKFVRNNDTLTPSYHSISILMIEGYDYQIAVPAINKTYRISGIVESKNTMACNSIFSMDKTYCLNSIQQYFINEEKVKAKLFERFTYLKYYKVV